jgi:galactose mutarotase-like enzyme
MAIVELKSEALQLRIQSLGAEICSILDLKTQFEFVWQAKPEVWKRHAPVLFPMVGKLKNNTFLWKDKAYTINQHGFARDMEFECIESSNHAAQFKLCSSPETLKTFPFEFELEITYRLNGNKLTQTYLIKNPAQEDLYCSVGAHPGFNFAGQIEDYSIDIESKLPLVQTQLKEGLLTNNKKEIGQGKTIPLNAQSFDHDALVFEEVQFDTLELRHQTNQHSVKIKAPDFPYWGIWAPKNCNEFVCLEPWCGIADHENHTQDWTQKKGILYIKHNQVLSRSFSIEFQAPKP